MSITYKDAEGVAGMRVACRLASEVLDYITPHIKPGVTTNEIDKLAHDYITQVQGGIPAPLNYGFTQICYDSANYCVALIFGAAWLPLSPFTEDSHVLGAPGYS